MSFLTSFTINNVLVVLTTFVFILYLFFKWSYTYWSRRGVITPSCSFPFGNLKEVALGRVSFQEMFKQSYVNLKAKGERYFGFYLLHQPTLVVFDRELIKSMMVKDFAHFTDHGLLDQKDYDTFGGNLFALKGAEWKTMREKLSPLFTSGKLKMMFPTIHNCSIQLCSLLNQTAKNSEKLDIKDIAGRYTTDIIASVAFGIEVNSLQNPKSDFRKYGERAVGHADKASELRFAAQMLIPELVTLFKVKFIASDVSDFFLQIVESTIKYREENNIVRKDFLQLMIQLKNNIDISDKSDCFNLALNNNNNNNGNMEGKKESCSLSIEDIVAQAMLFFLAGYDTSSLTISFCMYELAFNTDIQEMLRAEIKTVLNDHEGKLSYDAIMEMTYMDKCIKETLRKYPVLSNLFRRCTKAYQIPNSDLIIEKDMIVFIPINEIHYDPEYYPNPEKFDPERFSNENISARKSFTWLPFGEGPRLCIGTRLAMIQMKVALTTLLSDFRYSLHSKTAYPLNRSPRVVLISAKGGIWLNVEKIIE